MRSIGLRSLSASLVAAVLMALAPAGAAYGQVTFTVNEVADLVDADTVDDDLCDADLGTPGLNARCGRRSCRRMRSPGADTIVFDPVHQRDRPSLSRDRVTRSGAISTSAPTVTSTSYDDLVITGNGPANTIIQGGRQRSPAAVDRVLQRVGLLDDLRRHHQARKLEDRAGRRHLSPMRRSPSPTASSRGNEAFNANGFGNGGGIYSQDDLILVRVTISDNRASYGGGVFWHTSRDLLSITDTTFDNNHALGAPGAGGGLTSSLFGPDAAGHRHQQHDLQRQHRGTEGCAVYHENAPLRLHSVTVADNCAAGSVAAALVATYGDGNRNNGGEVRLKNSVVASPPGTDNCRVETVIGTPPGFVSEGHNLASDAACGLVQAGDVQGASPVARTAGEQRRPDADAPAARGQPRHRHRHAGGLPSRSISVAWAGHRTAAAEAAVCDKGSVEVAAAPPPPPAYDGHDPGARRGTTTTATSPSARRGRTFRPCRSACSRPSRPNVCTTAGDGTYRVRGPDLPGSLPRLSEACRRGRLTDHRTHAARQRRGGCTGDGRELRKPRSTAAAAGAADRRRVREVADLRHPLRGDEDARSAVRVTPPCLALSATATASYCRSSPSHATA